ncbi:hypothetical protein C8J57DRAFT_1724854 [Mycena rebaudengoi]|nr:hypothetical protein C8J57DRAFT_1724854 [Mycena rebaudengoi]
MSPFTHSIPFAEMAALAPGSHHLPQELLDYAVEFLQAGPESLRACAPASRSLTPAAQSQIFSYIPFPRSPTVVVLPHIPAVTDMVADMGLTNSSPRVIASFLEPRCHLDFNKLVDVTISRSVSPALVDVLQAARSTIQILTCNAFDLALLDISGFTALTTLNIKGDKSTELLLAVPTLCQLGATNVLRCMTLASSEFCSVDAPETIKMMIRDLDTRLAALPRPALHTVYIESDASVLNTHIFDIAQIVKGSMPAMANIAQVVVTTKIARALLP